MLSSRLPLAAVTVTAVLASTLAVITASPAPARADGTVVFDGMPTQDWADLASADPGKGGQAGWGDLPGGVTDRPYVLSLRVTNGATTTDLIANGGTTPPTPAPGGVSTVISPINLCRADQTPSPGACYATPNRVGLTVGYQATDTLGYNFANPSVPVSPPITAASVIDVTVALNTLGRSLRWTWVNGDLLWWRTTNLGQQNATVQLRFRPAVAPHVPYNTWPAGNGCSATPIFNCNLPRAAAEVLAANVVFSLDNTLDAALTGAVFATQNAISGYLQPAGTAQAPVLDIQAASTHLRSDGSLQRGTIKAFLPAAALINLYGVLPADAASAFTTTRTGSAGTNATPAYTPWTAATHGAEGLLVTVSQVTFSVPKYRVAGKLRPVASKAKVAGARTTITATVPQCTARVVCSATLYRVGRTGTARYTATRTAVLTNKLVRTRAVGLIAAATALRRGDRYLLVVRRKSNRALYASTVGTVR